MTEVVCEFTAPGPPEFRQKTEKVKITVGSRRENLPEFRQKAEKVKITVGSRRENFPYETSVEFKIICFNFSYQQRG